MSLLQLHNCLKTFLLRLNQMCLRLGFPCHQAASGHRHLQLSHLICGELAAGAGVLRLHHPKGMRWIHGENPRNLEEHIYIYLYIYIIYLYIYYVCIYTYIMYTCIIVLLYYCMLIILSYVNIYICIYILYYFILYFLFYFI